MGVQSARLLLILPLILREFSQVEIASWFLFSSILVFSNLVNQQVAMLFARFFALGIGGAVDLSPIMTKPRMAGNGSPNWTLVFRTFSTLGVLNACLAVVSCGVALVIGSYGLAGLLREVVNPERVWMAFGIMLFGEFLFQLFSRYSICLRGLNFVALTNRWSAAFSALSTASGAIALWLGAGIVQLAIVVQVFQMLAVGRFYVLLYHVAEPRLKEHRRWRLDREILRWAWKPFWKSFGVALANRGSLQICSVVFARYGDPSTVAGYLLSVRLFETVSRVALAPLSSHVPRFSRFLSEGRLHELRVELQRSTLMAQGIQVSGFLSVVLFGSFILQLIGSEVPLLDVHILIFLAASMVLRSALMQTLFISTLGNNILCFRRELLATTFTGLLAFILIPHLNVVGVIVAAFVPQLSLVNIIPLQVGSRMLDVSPYRYFRRAFAVPWAVFGVCSFLLIIYLDQWKAFTETVIHIFR